MQPIIKVKYSFESEIISKEWALTPYPNGDWIDLRCGTNMDIVASGIYAIPLGVCMELPLKYEAYIAPRSSLLSTHGLIGQFSIIDQSYRGTDDVWHLIAYATRNTRIEVGERIAQFRIMKSMEIPEFIEVSSLRGINRGGIGSTGKK